MLSKSFFLTIVLAIALSSCGIFSSLQSNTSITPNNSFILGSNKHGKFSAKLTNVSKQPLEIELKPIDGNATLLKTVEPNETVKVNVPSNTAIIIKNNSNDTVSVDLNVKGDTGLSMTYKK